jgi:hypothetical protein
MINYWWMTRPKRKLNSIPEVLATFAEISLDQEWQGQRGSHLSLEDALEQAGLKRIGERRDRTGGGARTYRAWVASLGLIFTQEATGKIKLTLAGEAIMNGDSPVEVLKAQIMKYQFPSAFSISRNIAVSSRFKIRPFPFLLKLLSDSRVEHLTEEEIAKIVAVEAETESDKCYEYVVSRILEFRDKGNACLAADFTALYAPSKGDGRTAEPYAHLTDLSNTIVNWLEYTQLAKRENREVRILDDKRAEVKHILNHPITPIDRPDQQEFFQRKYGVDPKHRKDTRNLAAISAVTAQIIAEQKIKNAFVSESLKKPITRITAALVDSICEITGIPEKIVEETLQKHYSRGSIGAFMTEYFEMAFKGRDEATEFEKATVELFRESFGFDAKHVGSIGLTPDVLLLSDKEGYQAIIDNKAYSKYTISNDHHNRMVHNYIGRIDRYGNSALQIAFFSYIAGGFGANIAAQLNKITDETGVHGSAVSVSNIITMVEKNQSAPYSHANIRDIFSLDRQAALSDLAV